MLISETSVSKMNVPVCVMVPTYNHAATLAKVVTDILNHGYDVLVVNDGSTDSTSTVLEQLTLKVRGETDSSKKRLYIVSYNKNRGKGFALLQAISRLHELGYRYAISIDADGQHSVKDILSFTRDIDLYPNALIVGTRGLKHDNMPKKNSFANRFSNFWFAVQTGRYLPDTQCGFRLYPVEKISKMRFLSTRYEWELEVLVRAAWAAIPIVPKSISVYYPPVEERVSHFRPGMDFFRISLLNTFLCLGALIYYYPVSLFRLFSQKPES
jgi:glycosyltransferase involved in cell wall biosynthesis